MDLSNFIIILCDNLGYGDIGCYGSKRHRTPHIDRMAKEGMRFTDFYATNGVCTPSRASLMTGCYPRRVNMHNVGRLLAYLDESGRSRDTVVIYTSDQGYFLGEHNLFDKRFMLEESLRMPFLIRYPREIKPGTTVDDITLNVDFAELFLDYSGAAIPSTMQGRSFRRNLTGHTPADWRDAMYYHYWAHQKERPSHYGVRTKRYKLIYYYGLLRLNRKPDECWELYDLSTDPREFVNQYDNPEYKDTVANLKQRLTELRRLYRDTEDPLPASKL